MEAPSTVSGPIVRRIAVAAAAVVLPLVFGTQLGKDPVIGLAASGVFIGFVMLFLRPSWFLMVGLFFFYGALKIVDTEVFGRVAGLFRLKDVFLVAIVGYVAAAAVLAPSPERLLRRNRIFLPYAAFIVWLGWEYFYTVVILKEDPVLAFRVGRQFLAYLFPVFLLRLMKTDRDWREFSLYLHGLALLGIALSVVSAMGISYTLVGDVDTLQVGNYQSGIFKFYNDVESLVYVMFALGLWRYAYRPTTRNLLLMVVFALGSGMFMFRARLAGLGLGLIVAAFFARPDARRRAAVAGVVAAVLLAVALTAIGVIVSQAAGVKDLRKTYVTKLADYFGVAAEGMRTGRTGDILYRQAQIDVRMPLVRQHPLCGIGFVSPFGRIAWDLQRYGLLAMGYVDVGWLDALMRLGGVGVFLLAALLAVSITQGRAVLRNQAVSPEGHACALTLVTYVVQMLVSTYTSCYPTWEPSILTYAILLSWSIRHAAVARQSPPGTPAGEAGRPSEESGSHVQPAAMPQRMAP